MCCFRLSAQFSLANLGISKIDEFRVNKSVRFGKIPIWYPYKSGPRISNKKSLKKRSSEVLDATQISSTIY